MRFGSHVSIKEGYSGAATRALNMNARSFQYFPKNPRSLSVKQYDADDTALCKEISQKNDLVSVAHTPYPTNLTAGEGKRLEVIESLINDLHIADSCGSVGVVVHFGKDVNDADPLVSYQLMIQTLNDVLSKWDGDCKLLIENNAGKPGSIGTTLEELVQVRKLTESPERIGFCLDTCHAFSSGLWDGDNWSDVVSKGKELGFFQHLSAIHLNNSKYPTSSGKDRHANIFNHGHIKAYQFGELFNSALIKDIPLILETPTDLGVTHEEEIRQLYSYISKKST